jgi:hypothetical protein
VRAASDAGRSQKRKGLRCPQAIPESKLIKKFAHKNFYCGPIGKSQKSILAEIPLAKACFGLDDKHAFAARCGAIPLKSLYVVRMHPPKKTDSPSFGLGVGFERLRRPAGVSLAAITRSMSAFGAKADIQPMCCDVCF